MNSSSRFPDERTALGRKLVWALPVLMSFCVSILSPQAGQAQGVSSSRQTSHPSAPRMGVIESQRAFAGTSIYTVIGAVQQSGAYHSQDDAVALDQLIAAAGGLTPDASPTLRIVRAGQVRFQVYYDPSQPNPANRLSPGDIVIAISTPAATRPTTVPVACVGLLDRPVVLPLDPAIQTVNELTARLGQPQEAARVAKVISPTGDAHGRLYPGSVVIFPASLVDRLPLEQPGFLPPSFDLKPFTVPNEKAAVAVQSPERDLAQLPFPERTSAQPIEFRPEGQDRPVLPSPTVTSPLRSDVPVSSAPASTVAPLGLKAPGSEPFPPQPQQSRPQQPTPPSSLPPQSAQATQHGLTLPEPPQLVSMDTEHDSGAPSRHLFAAPSIDGIQESRITSTAGVVDGAKKSAGLVFADESSPFGMSRESQFQPQASTQPLMRSDTSPQFARTVPPAAESLFSDSAIFGSGTSGTGISGTGTSGTGASGTGAIALATPGRSSPVKEQSGNVPSESSRSAPVIAETEKPTPTASAWPMIFGITALLSCVLTSVVFWSSVRTSEHHSDLKSKTEDHAPESHLQPASDPTTNQPTISQPQQINIMAGEPHVENSNPMLQMAGHPVIDLVQHRIPMMEEKVVVPSQWPLHGGVVGHRRLILNSAHESVPAPHFDLSALAEKQESRRTREQKVDERQLRRDLRAAVGSIRIDPAEGNVSSVEEVNRPAASSEKPI
ncbi:MAG TPA: hypothetical protein VNQ76_19990, partial [Planctomicrobium sp.]|nr:hypothetical protein [Planctomicrobium sp.]